METSEQSLQPELFLPNNQGRIPIEDIMSFTRVQKLNYALTICEDKTSQHTQKHKNAALAYLINTLNINCKFPKILNDKEIIEKIKNKNLIKDYTKDSNSALQTKSSQASTPNENNSTIAPQKINFTLKNLALIKNLQNPQQGQIGNFIADTNKI